MYMQIPLPLHSGGNLLSADPLQLYAHHVVVYSRGRHRSDGSAHQTDVGRYLMGGEGEGEGGESDEGASC